MARQFVVVGGGLQGRVIAQELARRPKGAQVTILDSRPAPADLQGVTWQRADVVKGSPAASRLLKAADAAVVALPGSVADAALPTIVRLGVPVADVSFTPEAQSRSLDQEARRAGAPLVRDVGVAPGLSHILTAATANDLRGLTDLTVYVGGLPQRPPNSPFRHAVYFNALDLVSEYLRPARMRRRGKAVHPDPLSPREGRKLRDRELGALEGFPSDGLRSLLTSFPHCKEMTEVTLRWPGHLREMRRLGSNGLLISSEDSNLPSLLTALALEEAFPGREHPDVLLMEVHGRNGRKKAAWRLVDREKRGATAMSRTTGFTAAAVARALAAGAFDEPGLHFPEELGRLTPVRQRILSDLRAAGLKLTRGSKLSEAA